MSAALSDYNSGEAQRRCTKRLRTGLEVREGLDDQPRAAAAPRALQAATIPRSGVRLVLAQEASQCLYLCAVESRDVRVLVS